MLTPEERLPPTFCSLRWRYMQCDLTHAQVKACCKTPFVQITDDDVAAQGHRSVFNHPYFVERRREMLAGSGHADCDVCTEHDAAGIISYRRSEGSKPIFATPRSRAEALAELDDAWPSHVEIMLSTTCDLRCAYCDPRFSSAWAAELRSGDAATALTDIQEEAPASADFKKTFEIWLRKALPRIRYLQFNGGEPLLQKEFYRFLEMVAPYRGRLQLGIITNLNTPDRAFGRFLAKLPELLNAFQLRIAVSQEAVGARAEYIRYGLVWRRFEDNLRLLLPALRGRTLHLAPTMSALNVTSFGGYVSFIESLAHEHGCDFFWRPSLVHAPAHLSPLIAGPEERRELSRLIARLEESGRWPDLRLWLQRLVDAIGSPRDVGQRRLRLADWIARHDRGRATDFAAVFPELSWLARRTDPTARADCAMHSQHVARA